MLIPMDGELVFLHRWLDELDTVRDGVATRLEARRAELAEATIAAMARVAARPATTPAPVRPKLAKVRRVAETPVTRSWWADAPRESFTAHVQRAHLARMAASKEAARVAGITVGEIGGSRG